MKTALSLSTRLLGSTCIILLVFFGATIWLLDSVFRTVAVDGMTEQLDVQVMALLAAAELRADGTTEILEARLTDPRFATPGSGLYAEVADGDGIVSWRSNSAVGLDLGLPLDLGIGERRIDRVELQVDGEALVLSVGLAWFDPDAAGGSFQIRVAESLKNHRAEQRRFRRQISAWFGVVTLMLLMAFTFLLRWGLRPLRRMATGIREIEAGRAQQLGDGYPPELAGLARNMNTLIATERRRRSRYRETMENLAHSLKTPLAIVRSAIAGKTPDTQTLEPQVSRMEGVIAYQLKRAAAAGLGGLGQEPVEVLPVAQQLRDSLCKLHADRRVAIELDIAEDCKTRIDEGDLYELLGNLMDNASKWCAGRVLVKATEDDGVFRITVNDDGPGIPDDLASQLQERGQRADQGHGASGQGIGLAVVREIAELYGGSLELGKSSLGGVSATVETGVH